MTLTAADFRRIALGMQDTIESAHMGHPDFRVNGRIFATLKPDPAWGMVALTPEQQQIYVRKHPAAFTPENGAWGLQGATSVRLDAVDEEVLGEALTLARRNAVEKGAPRRSKTKPRLLLAAAWLAMLPYGCGPTPRYVTTISPINVGVSPRGLCIAVDPGDPHGVWWWEPGDGCASRASGPGVFHADLATVAPSAQSGRISVSFRLGTHSATRPVVDVQLVVEKEEMLALETQARVPVERRRNLEVREQGR